MEMKFFITIIYFYFSLAVHYTGGNVIGSSTIKSFFDRIIILTRITNNRSFSLAFESIGHMKAREN